MCSRPVIRCPCTALPRRGPDTARLDAPEINEETHDAQMREDVDATIASRTKATYKVPIQVVLGPVIFQFTIHKHDINFSVTFQRAPIRLFGIFQPPAQH